MVQYGPYIIVAIASTVSIGIAIWSRSSTREDDFRRNKVDINDCAERHLHIQNFKTRIGQESDAHRKCINKLEKGMVFLVQQQGGDPSAMGLMD